MNGPRVGEFKRLRQAFSRFLAGARAVADQRRAGALSVALASLLMALPGGWAADEGVYTWKDGAGRVHYSNRRPEGHPAETVELNAKPVVVQPTETIYSWIDDRGKVHYGAKPPANFPVKKLKEEDSSLSTVPFDPQGVDRKLDQQPLMRELQRRD